MKKIKLFALALMATFSLSAMAQTITLADITPSSNWYEVTGVGRVANKSGNSAFGSGDVSCTPAGFKTGSSYFSMQTYQEISAITVTATSGSNRTISQVYSSATLGSSAPSSTNVSYVRTGGTESYPIPKNSCGNTFTLTFDENIPANNYIQIVLSGNADIAAVEFIPGETCEEPTAGELSLSSNAPAALYEGTEVTISMAGGHGSGRSLTLDGETWMGYPTWTAVAGKHVIRVSEPVWEDTESGVTYCAGEDSVVLNVLAATPVTECAIAGPATGYVGSQLTYTATAANATTYEWYVDGVAANTNSATFVYTANALGVHEIKATASNQYTTTPVESNVIDLNVTPLYGELIKAELKGGTSATVGGIIGGTFDSNLDNGKYKIDKNKYVGIQLAQGNFMEGDTVVITLTTKGSNYPCLFADKERTNCLFLATEASEDLVYKIELPAAANNVNSLYLSRGDDTDDYKWNPVLSSMAVIRPLDDGTPVLKASKTTIDLAVTADNPNPTETVTFTGKHLTPGTYNITGGGVQNLVINPTSVTVDADGKLNAQVTFSYSNDNDVLPFEAIKSLWVDAEGGSKGVQISINLSATHAIEYSSSLNIEQLILENGTKADIAAALDAAKIQYENIDALDTLNDQKANRNEPYLGLKLKKSGACIKVAVEAGKELNVRFGAHTAMVNVSINGTPIDGGVLVDIYDYNLAAAAEDRIVTFTTSSDATVVVKQIMVGEDLVDVVLPAQVMFVVNCVTSENGKVTASWEGKGSKDIAAAEGTLITLTVTPNANYETDQVTAGNEIIIPDGDVYSFTMIGQDIDVIATFKATASALDEAEEAVKAHKLVRDGQIIIIRGEKEFNAQGAQLK